MPRHPPLRVAIAGLGTVGRVVADRLDAGIDGLVLAAVSARDRDRAATRVAAYRRPPPVLALSELGAAADVIVECAPAAVYRESAESALRAGRTFVTISVGALLEHPDLVDLAREHAARIVVPSGALLGLDAVRAAAADGLRAVRMITRKPPGGLAGAPWLVEHGIDVADLREPLKVFDGNAREGAAGFPANVNVAAALGLAGLGPDRTALEIWADPGLTRNTHHIVVEADAARFEMTIENVPSTDNPRTGRLVAPSVIATLERLVAPLVVGT